MVTTCLEKGIINDAEHGEWTEFLDREKSKEQQYEEAEQIVYRSESCTDENGEYLYKQVIDRDKSNKRDMLSHYLLPFSQGWE